MLLRREGGLLRRVLKEVGLVRGTSGPLLQKGGGWLLKKEGGS